MLRCCRCGAENETVNKHNRRCAVCQRSYQREWERLSKQRTVRAGFNMGVVEARDRIAAEFDRLGDREMNGVTAAKIVRELLFA